MSHYKNANGLVDGKIPSGHACPFLSQCGLREDQCPAPGNLKGEHYSCGAARAHSLLKVCDNVLLRKVVERRSTFSQVSPGIGDRKTDV